MVADVGVTLRALILGVSVLAAGLAAYMALLHGIGVVRYRRIWDFWWFSLFSGLAGVILLVGQLVLGTPRIEPTWQAFSYGACLTAITIGTFGIAATKTRYGKRADDEPAE